jgi:hypothetical protein
MGLKDEKIVRGTSNVEKTGMLDGQKGPKGRRPRKREMPRFLSSGIPEKGGTKGCEILGT